MILLMGMPGSGKGTQGKMLADLHGFHLISMGDLVRLYVTGERRQEMLQGKILDDREVTEILDKVLRSIPDTTETILDGYPRTIPQAEWILENVRSGRFNLKHIFYLVASEDAVKDRLRARGRNDDHEEVIEERFREYQRLTMPLIDWFKEHGLTVTEIPAERTVDEVHQDLLKHLKAE